MNSYEEAAFQRRLTEALERVQQILGDTKRPKSAAETPHLYEDKFRLAEFMASAALATVAELFEVWGLGRSGLEELRRWPHPDAAVLRFAVEERCSLEGKEEKEVEISHERSDVTTKGLLSRTKSRQERVVQIVTQHRWRFEVRYRLAAVSVREPGRQLPLLDGQLSCPIFTTTDAPPRPKIKATTTADLPLRRLLPWLDDRLRFRFAIDRNHEDCLTPRRNPQVDELLDFFQGLFSFSTAVHRYFLKECFAVSTRIPRPNLEGEGERIFLPVLPLLLEPPKNGEGADVLFGPADVNALLEHHRQSLKLVLDHLTRTHPDGDTLQTAAAARLAVSLEHGAHLAQQSRDALAYLETMLEQQLRAAIGRSVGPSDFSEYMRFHASRLFGSAYAPRPFVHAVRRPEHVPEGAVTLSQMGPKGFEPISSFARSGEASSPMHLQIDAATRVAFFGERHVHGFLDYRFADEARAELRLEARAREFSGFIVLAGRIAGPDRFEPEAALLVQNRDELRIPLFSETIPSPKEFRDAIASMSPEQQRFAKAFRSMQLESTLFGICVIQVKPHLERLLQLPDDALTKEIRLTQQLIELFVTYQIPSDLLSYDGPEDKAATEKVERVKAHVGKMMDLISQTKSEELEGARQSWDMRRAESGTDLSVTVQREQAWDPEVEARVEQRRAQLDEMIHGIRPPTSMAGGRFHPPPPMSAPRATFGGRGGDAPSFTPAPEPPASAFAFEAAADPIPPPEPAAHERPGPGPAASHPSFAADLSTEPDSGGVASEAGGEDYTQIPVRLDTRFGRHDKDNALRPTILRLKSPWELRTKESLLSPMRETVLDEDMQTQHKARAFDLLDALSRSGTLPLHHAALHVLVGATHGFDRSLVEMVIEKNVNPIERVEASSLIVASTIFGKSVLELTQAAHHGRLESAARLLDDGENGA